MTWKKLKNWQKSSIISILAGLLIYADNIFNSTAGTPARIQSTVDLVYSVILLFISLWLIYWLVHSLEAKINFRDWFFSRAPWKSGMMLGAFISSIIPLLGSATLLMFHFGIPYRRLISNAVNFPSSLMAGIFTGNFFPSQYVGEAFIFFIPLSVIFYALIGAIAGHTIKKMK